MRLKFMVLVLLAAMFCAVPGSHAAQATGFVTGQVIDETGGVLPGVTVELRVGGSEEDVRVTVTDGEGRYLFENVPEGPVNVTLTMINFGTMRSEAMVMQGEPITWNAMMELSFSADVTITAPRAFRNIAELPNPEENLIRVAEAASQGAITGEQLQARPLMRPAEALETVPGLIVSQHSGEGKANQYYLRGFNLDHGTDFATTVVGIPMNAPSHAHFHGYTDTNFLIPELVSGIQYKKGPYYAEEGDFSSAGAVNVNYVNRLETPVVTFSGGTDGWGRLFAGASPEVGRGFLLGALELNVNDGPWDHDGDFKKANALVRYSHGDSRNGLSVTGLTYVADWHSSDQVPQRAIQQGLISRFGHIDDTDAGESSRHAIVVDGQRSGVRTSTRTTGYLMAYRTTLFSNFTYFLDDPVNGDQFEQTDHRITGGGRVAHRRLHRVGDRPLESAMGVQVKYDRVNPTGLYRTVAQQRISTTNEDRLNQTSVGVFGQTEVEWSHVLRTTFGLRADVFHYDVHSSVAANSGTATEGVLSPKFGAVLGPWRNSEVYVNAGTGYHTNDGRGATLTVDPISGEPAQRGTPIANARGAELGVRTVPIQGVQSTVSAWYLGLDSELLYIGDIGSTEPSDPTRRYGVEWTNYARLTGWLRLDADASFSRARFVGAAADADHVPGAVGRVISAGFTVESEQPVFGTLRLRHFGPRALVEDDSVRSESTNVFNGEVGYRVAAGVNLVLELYNLFDAEVSDIDYFYASRLPGEPVGGVEDIHTHPALPRTGRVSLQVRF
jgi:hypothetical protein